MECVVRVRDPGARVLRPLAAFDQGCNDASDLATMALRRRVIPQPAVAAPTSRRRAQAFVSNGDPRVDTVLMHGSRTSCAGGGPFARRRPVLFFEPIMPESSWGFSRYTAGNGALDSLIRSLSEAQFEMEIWNPTIRWTRFRTTSRSSWEI